ncbi:MAG: AraC family transcriptional regulator [Dysgonamonadaceae bacterium]|jgi:AraC-like DNA-binding protein|nr:AraC family transcriptional regulator [Dysgonamonadaceae bacterium]
MSSEYNDLETRFKYLIPNDKDRKFGLWVNTVGFECIPPNSPYPLEDHPSGYFFNTQKGRILHEYQLLYITKGKGVFSSENMLEKQVGKGSLIILFPGLWHTFYSLKETGWNDYYIGFEGTVIDNLVKEGFLSNEKNLLEVGLNEELASLFARALEIAEADRMASQQQLSGIVLYMIGMILSISKNDNANSINNKIEKAKIIMNENVFKEIDPEELAAKLCVSYSNFRKTFKEYTGFAPAKYFRLLKLHKAKQLLIESSYSVKEISFMLGYESTEHFNSLFKKYFELTPLEYRHSAAIQKFKSA